MVCLNPKIAYQRRYYPKNGNISERNLKRLNRISFKYKEGWKQIELPCGECAACRLAKANEWATRIECESKTWDDIGIFVTLTYNDKNLPLTDEGLPTLKKKDIQDFKKRLRKYIAKNKEAFKSYNNPDNGKEEFPIRTFECGEYGPTRGRPHYHMIIFNWIPKDLKFYKNSKSEFPIYTSKTLSKIWGKGFCPIGTISYKSASYVARYTMKKNGLAKTRRKYYTTYEWDEEFEKFLPKTKYQTIKGKIEPEFISMSNRKGIGYQFFMDHKKQIISNNGILVSINGKVEKKGIPRYFRKIMEKIDWIEYERWKYNHHKLIEQAEKKKIEQYNLPGEWLYEQKRWFIKKKEIERIKIKLKLVQHRDNTDE